jgi:hypothetical protein
VDRTAFQRLWIEQNRFQTSATVAGWLIPAVMWTVSIMAFAGSLGVMPLFADNMAFGGVILLTLAMACFCLLAIVINIVAVLAAHDLKDHLSGSVSKARDGYRSFKKFIADILHTPTTFQRWRSWLSSLAMVALLFGGGYFFCGTIIFLCIVAGNCSRWIARGVLEKQFLPVVEPATIDRLEGGGALLTTVEEKK